MQGRERVRTLSFRRSQPHTTNPWKVEKDTIVGDKKERAEHANRKELALLLRPSSLTPSNTGSLRSFQRASRRAQSFCDTKKSYNEEARMNAYEKPKHHEKHGPAHTAMAMHNLKDALGYS